MTHEIVNATRAELSGLQSMRGLLDRFSRRLGLSYHLDQVLGSRPTAAPRTLIAGQPGDRFTLQVDLQDGKRSLPIVTLKRAA